MTATFKSLSATLGAEPVVPANRAGLSLDHGSAARSRPLTPGLYSRFGKRLLDIILVLLSAPVTVTVVLVLAVLTALDGGSPFYWQDRIGRGGSTFRLLKIRSMVPDADTLLAAHLDRDPAARREWDSTQKLKDDPRITRLGWFLRKASLDELPQLWNVLCGDMSIVGPRPMMPQQRVLYPGSAYFALRPGLTGPWQVSDRNRSTFADRAIFDTRYQAELSAKTDMVLILRTVKAVLHGTGC